MKILARKILRIFRIIQYALYGRKKYGTIDAGNECHVEPFRYEINHGDIVHPCVRYIPEGYLGHHWWMVYTPYYKSDASLENPVLCYADSDDLNIPPMEWKHFCLVNEKLGEGYNSDPTLLFHNRVLYVFWRENYENGCRPYYRATFAAKVVRDGVERIAEPLLVTNDAEIDAETCPCFMPTNNGGVMAYGMHLCFHSPRIKQMQPLLKRWVAGIALVTDLLGGYSQQKHYGLAIWKPKSDNWLQTYNHVITHKFKSCNALYRLWHMDFFDWEGKRYCVLQTNQCNADIALAVSDDNEHFTLFKKPLITNDTIGKLGIYKPCAGVTQDGIFYLYYTAQDKENRALNKLYLSKMPFERLLSLIS